MKNRYILTLCLAAFSAISLYGQGEPPKYSTENVTAAGWVEIKGNSLLGTRVASIQANSGGVTVTNWDGVYKLEPNGAHLNVTPRQGIFWTYGVSFVYNDTLYVPARYLPPGQGVDSSKVFISGNNGLSWSSENGPAFPSGNVQVNTDIRIHSDTMYLMGDDELYYSADFGKTWINTNPISVGCSQVNDVLIYDGQLYMTGCNSLNGVYKLDKTTNTWAIDNSFPTNSSHRFMLRDSIVFLASKDTIQKKHFPSGSIWQQATNGLSQFYLYNHLNVNQNLFFCSSVGVFKSDDYGNNWSDFNAGWADPTTMYPVNIAVYGDTLYVASYSKGVYKQAIPPNPISLAEVKNRNHNFEIFPNPASDHITISTQKEGTGSFKIYDQSGKLMMDGKFKNGESININGLDPGLYLLKITHRDEVGEQKLIVR